MRAAGIVGLVLVASACADESAVVPPEDVTAIPDVPIDTGEAPDEPGLTIADDGEIVVVDNGLVRVMCRAVDGTCDLVVAASGPAVQRAWSQVRYRLSDSPDAVEVRSLDAGPVTWTTETGESPLGAYAAVAVVAAGSEAPELTTELRVYEGQPFVTIDLTVHNTLAQPIALVRVLPWTASVGEGGGLFVGADPKDHVVLDSGQLKYMDFEATLHEGLDNTIANWNAAVVDRTSGRGVVAGWLSMTQVAPLVALRNAWDEGLKDPETGRRGFAELSFEAEYEPARPLAPGQAVTVDRAYVDAATGDPHEALEQYAERIRINLGYSLWSGPSPNGWNSWAASGSTGGYGTSIDEALMLDNLAFMAEHLRDFGMHYFQLDDGWQNATGDWEPHAERFPHGMQWMAEQIAATGLIPGTWIEPMTVSVNSQLYADHPEWTVAGPDGPLLDPSMPEVRAHLTALFQKVTKQWGYRWIKVDFAYRLLLAGGYADPTMTSEEVYRAGMQAIRDGLAEGTFFLSVAAPGLNYDISHANRITLDTMPWWGDTGTIAAQGFKDIARTVARRWYLHGRAQITHPDLIIFRAEGKGGTPIDTPNALRPLHETMAFATMVGLCGGIVKIGDRMAVDLGAAQIDVLRRLLPSYDAPGRPLDVFERTTPELWELPVSTSWESWTVLGLINWGLNGAGTTVEDTVESVRHFDVPLDRLRVDDSGTWLAFEYWSETFLGQVTGALKVDVQPRHAALVSLRPLRPDQVQLLATNRHVTMGGTDITEVTWDADAGVLEGRQPLVAGWSYRLFFHVPPGRQVTSATLDGEPVTMDLPAAHDGRLLVIAFEPDQAADSAVWRVE